MKGKHERNVKTRSNMKEKKPSNQTQEEKKKSRRRDETSTLERGKSALCTRERRLAR